VGELGRGLGPRLHLSPLLRGGPPARRDGGSLRIETITMLSSVAIEGCPEASDAVHGVGLGRKTPPPIDPNSHRRSTPSRGQPLLPFPRRTPPPAQTASKKHRLIGHGSAKRFGDSRSSLMVSRFDDVVERVKKIYGSPRSSSFRLGQFDSEVALHPGPPSLSQKRCTAPVPGTSRDPPQWRENEMEALSPIRSSTS